MIWVYDIRVQASFLEDWSIVDMLISFYLRNILNDMKTADGDLRVLRILVDKSKTDVRKTLENYKMFYLVSTRLKILKLLSNTHFNWLTGIKLFFVLCSVVLFFKNETLYLALRLQLLDNHSFMEDTCKGILVALGAAYL